jgi:hypothetical protein
VNSKSLNAAGVIFTFSISEAFQREFQTILLRQMPKNTQLL